MIQYAIVVEFGTVRRRILNDNDAVRAFQSMTGRKTLTLRDVADLRALGVPLWCENFTTGSER